METEKRMNACESLKTRFYVPQSRDNDSIFLEKIAGSVTCGSCVLDIGAGSGLKFQYHLKQLVEPDGKIVGADFDPRVRQNSLLHYGVVLEDSTLPFGDSSFDIAFARYVLEHIENPMDFLAEVYRILEPGGLFFFLTPNKWHYVSLASRFSPQIFHGWYNRLRGRDESDTFPTLYRLNTRPTVVHYLQRTGFQKEELMMLECCPNYLTISTPLFLAGVIYERILNSTEKFAGLRANILGIYRKPS